MKKFDNHVTKLQKEMIDITKNLNKFRNKNHKTISLIINNLNVISNEIANNNLEYDTNLSNKQSQIDCQKNPIDIYNENKKYNHSSLPKKNEINNRNIMNSNLSEKNFDNYKTFYNNHQNYSSKLIGNNFIQTPTKEYFRVDNDYLNDYFDNKLLTNKNSETFNKFYHKNKNIIISKNNSRSINQKYKENKKINNFTLKNENKYLTTELVNKKKNNTITNLLFNNKKDFIYFNRNKQNYYKQYNQRNNSNKIKTCYYTTKNNFIINQKNRRKINTQDIEDIKNIFNNDTQENNKNNDINDSSDNNINNNIEEKNSKKYQNEETIEINDLLKVLKLNNVNDLKEKLRELNNIKKFSKKVVSLYYKFNNISSKDDINLDDILYWISSLSKIKNEKDEYKQYCMKLMRDNHINNFNELKSFIDNILNKNIQNNNFIGGVKKILSTNIDDNSDFNFY